MNAVLRLYNLQILLKLLKLEDDEVGDVADVDTTETAEAANVDKAAETDFAGVAEEDNTEAVRGPKALIAAGTSEDVYSLLIINRVLASSFDNRCVFSIFIRAPIG